jgi:hypothetical protein
VHSRSSNGRAREGLVRLRQDPRQLMYSEVFTFRLRYKVFFPAAPACDALMCNRNFEMKPGNETSCSENLSRKNLSGEDAQVKRKIAADSGGISTTL